MIRAGLVIAACLALLTGCASVSGRVFPRHYALAAPTQVTPGRTRRAGGPVLEVARIDTPPWLAGTGLYYRLQYRRDDQIAAYARSDWVAPPAKMLGQVVRGVLAADHEWKAVLGPATPAHADFALHIRLDDFSQVFASPSQSEGVLDAVVTLVDDHHGDAIAQRHFHCRAPAPTADAAGGVKALNHVSREFAARLQRWLRTTMEHTARQRRRMRRH